MHTKTHTHRGARAQRMDHYQVLVPDVLSAAKFYMDLGFRISQSAADAHGADGSPNGKPRAAAFFDLDKTLMAGSSGIYFARAAYETGMITRRRG